MSGKSSRKSALSTAATGTPHPPSPETPAALAVAIDGPALVDAAVASLRVNDIVDVANALPAVGCRVLLDHIGMRAAQHAGRAMASQVLAQLRAGGSRRAALLPILFPSDVAVFASDVDPLGWACLSSSDDWQALKWLASHQQVAVGLAWLAERPASVQRLQLAMAVEAAGVARLAALGMLAHQDPDAAEAYARVVAQMPDLPNPFPSCAAISPQQRLRNLGADESDLGDPRNLVAVLEKLAQTAPEERPSSLSPQPEEAPATQDDAEDLAADDVFEDGLEDDDLYADDPHALLGPVWDDTTAAAAALVSDLQDGIVPAVGPARRLVRFLTRMQLLVADLDEDTREGLVEALDALEHRDDVAPARAWLLRLAQMTTPPQVAAAAAQVALIATEAAHLDEHTLDDALRALLTLIELATARTAGADVQFADIWASQQAAAAGLPEHDAVVTAAASGFVSVPPPEPGAATTAPVQQPSPEPRTTPSAEPHVAQASLPVEAATQPEPAEAPAPAETTTSEPMVDVEPPTPQPSTQPDAGAGLPVLGVGAALARLGRPTAASPRASARRDPAPAATTTAAPQDATVVEPAPEPARPVLPAWTQEGVSSRDARLLADGRYGLAADIATALQAPQACVAARQLAANAHWLTQPTGQAAARFSEHALAVTREQLGDDRAGQVIAWAAAAKAALLAPGAGPVAVLENLTPAIAAEPELVEVTAALIEASRSGVVVVDPQTVKVSGALAAGDARLREMRAAAEQYLTWARTRALKYAPANEVYKAWVSTGGPLAALLTAVAENDTAAVADVQQMIVSDLKGRADKHVDSTFAQTAHNRRAKLVAQPRQALIERWDEIVDLGTTWAELCEQMAAAAAIERTGTWQSAPLARLRSRLQKVHQGAVSAFEEMCSAVGIAGPNGPAQMLSDIYAACDGVTPGRSEPPTAWIEHSEILTASADRPAAGQAADPTRIPFAQLSFVADEPERGPADIFDALVQTGALDLAPLAARAQAALGAPGDLDARLARAVQAADSRARAQLAAARSEVDLRRISGVLDDEPWAAASARLDALAEQGRRDYDRIHAGLRGISDLLDRERDQIVARMHQEVTAVATATPAVADALPELTKLLDAGEVTAAQELLQQAREGQRPTGDEDRVSHLQAFFPALPDLFKRYPRTLDAVLSGLRNTDKPAPVLAALKASGVDFSQLSERRQHGAREAMTAWADLANQRGEEASEGLRLARVLVQAGLQFESYQRERDGSRRDQVWGTLSGVTRAGKALSPILGSEMSPDGSLQVLLVRSAPTPATVVETVASTRTKDRTVLALWLGDPLSADQWRSVGEAAQGHASNAPVIMLDAAVLTYLCAQAEPRLSPLAEIALPFTSTNPYRDTPGDAAPEMFFGRTEELAEIVAMNGSSFVCGGRQLGKSALLRQAARQFNEQSKDNLAVVTSIFGVGKAHDPAAVWTTLWPELAKAGVVTGTMPESDVAAAVHAQIRRWLEARPARRLLLLLDEADEFLDDDAAGNQFTNVEWFRRIMSDTGRAAKIVLAGLHRTARFQPLPNQPMHHFGAPIVVGPLRPHHARALITRPMAAVGYTFADSTVVARVLSEANNMPAQLQLIGRALVEHMAARPLVPGTPPRVITAEDVTAAFTPRLREDLRDKFTITLTLDPRYKVIANVIAQAAYEHGADASVSLSDLSTNCRGAWPEGFASLNTDSFRALVTECVDLGVLAKDDGQYRLRTPAVRRLLGSAEDVLEELTAATAALDVPVLDDASVFRRKVRDGALSPLTERQLGSIFSARRAVLVITGSSATGLDQVLVTLEDVASSTPVHVSTRATGSRPEQVTAAIGRATGRAVVPVDARTVDADSLIAVVDAAEAALSSTHQEVTAVIVAGPSSAAAWAYLPRRIELSPIGIDAVRLLPGADILPLKHHAQQERMATLTSGWYSLVSKVLDDYRHSRGQSSVDDILTNLQNARTPVGRLARTAGLQNAPALEQLTQRAAGLTESAHEDLDTLAALIEDDDTSDVLAALHTAGYANCMDALDALVALAILRPDASGKYGVDPALARDLSAALA